MTIYIPEWVLWIAGGAGALGVVFFAALGVVFAIGISDLRFK